MNSQSRVLFAGTGSGCGKTTVTAAVMKALGMRSVPVCPFKCGPDYIDPMFHTHITGVPSTNLDSFFLSQNDLCWLLREKLTGTSEMVGIIEGVMGFFDGIGTGTTASTFEIAKMTRTPVILVVNARGVSLSVLAVIQGFLDFAKEAGGEDLIRGVILNQISKSTCAFLKPVIEERTGLKVLGFLERRDLFILESRHLGLVPAGEVADLDRRLEEMAGAAAESLDLEGILQIAKAAEPLFAAEPEFIRRARRFREACGRLSDCQRQVRALGVARDAAFCFYYEENLEHFRRLGIELVPFSPLEDPKLPEGISGLYLGGGYPELFARQLSENVRLLEDLKQKCESGLPIIAECGGYLYLLEQLDGVPMAGVIAGQAQMTHRSGPFGYVHVQANRANIFGRAGTSFRGHEFHYSVTDGLQDAFTMVKGNGRSWQGGYSTRTMYAAYPHLYFDTNAEAMIHFVKAMRAWPAPCFAGDPSDL